MTKINPFDAMRTDMVDAMRKAKAEMAAYAKDVAPYNSVKLSPEESLRTFMEPWRLFPDEPSQVEPGRMTLTLAEGYARARQTMGDVKYVAWWRQYFPQTPLWFQQQLLAPPVPIAPPMPGVMP